MYSTPLITSNISSRMRRIYLSLHIYQTWNAKTQNQTAQVQTISYLLPIIKRRPLSKCRKTAWPLSQTMYNRPGKGKQTVNDSPVAFTQRKINCVVYVYLTKRYHRMTLITSLWFNPTTIFYIPTWRRFFIAGINHRENTELCSGEIFWCIKLINDLFPQSLINNSQKA